MNRLETQLARLVEQQVLSVSQARQLADAATADQVDGQPAAAGPALGSVGAALGLVAAGAVLIATVIVLSRRRRVSTAA